MIGRKKQKTSRAVVLIDFENLEKNTYTPDTPEKFSMTAGLDRLIKQIAQEVGEIVNVFVFVPLHSASLWGETFHEEGFITVFCPSIRNKEGIEENTVDSTLIKLGENMISLIKEAYPCDNLYLVLGSGDKDFSLLVRKAIRMGFKIIVIAGSTRSLSFELRRLADRVFFFSPTKE